MKGLSALVTGGGSGIGFAVAKMLLKEGARVAIAGRDSRKLKAAIEELAAGDDTLRYFAADVSSEGYANKLVGETVSAFGRLDILINCAGIFRMSSIFENTEEDFDEVIATNLKGTWFMCKYGARAMKDTGGGVIVNVASLLGMRAAQGFPTSIYSASKGGVLALTRELALELAPFAIRVNAVVPALIRTPMLSAFADIDRVQELLEKSKKAHPLGRIGEPEDVALAIVFLARPENSWITAAELTVDGGRSAL